MIININTLRKKTTGEPIIQRNRSAVITSQPIMESMKCNQPKITLEKIWNLDCYLTKLSKINNKKQEIKATPHIILFLNTLTIIKIDNIFNPLTPGKYKKYKKPFINIKKVIQRTKDNIKGN